jgi:hypothetical protein
MKTLALLLVFGLLPQAILKSAEPSLTPLKDVPFNYQVLEVDQTHQYKWVSITQDKGKKVSKDYATLVVSSKLEKDDFLLHDTIALLPSPENEKAVFDRNIKYPRDNLLQPEQITLDIAGDGQSVRQLSYANGEMKFVDDDGTTKIGHPKLDHGILTFNALLRLAPFLPRDLGKVYTFQAYAEPFLFRIHQLEESGDSFTITCAAAETVILGKKSYSCVKFRMDLKSVNTRTDVWVGDNNLVVKFTDTPLDDPAPYLLEATLQE